MKEIEVKNINFDAEVKKVSEISANNFICNLPGGLYRWQFEQLGLLDMSCSHLGGRTQREFIRDLDSAIEMEGISVDKIKELMAYHRKGIDIQTPKGKRSHQELITLTFPAICDLFKKGYTWESFTT